MTRLREALPVGWRPGPFESAAICAGVLLAAAVAVHLAGLATGGGLLAVAAVAALAVWNEAELEGPRIRVRSAASRWRAVSRHARAIDRFEYRRGMGRPRLSLRIGPTGVVLRATGPSPRADAYRQAAMWLIVHGRRQARIDAPLLDALGAMTDHARSGQPHDASHA